MRLRAQLEAPYLALPRRGTLTPAAEPGDVLSIVAGAGDDTIDASSVQAGKIGLSLNGGAGSDVIRGSHGDDFVAGGTVSRHRSPFAVIRKGC